MAKALTMPTAPEAPMAPHVSIGDRIHNIENRIEEIEGISGINSGSKSRNSSQNQQRDEEPEEVAEDQEEEQQQQAVQQTQPQRSQPQQRQSSPQNVTTPESMARDAVANGSGALTKRTTTRSKDDAEANPDNTNAPSKNQSTIVIPPDSNLSDNGQSSFERGRAVLNEFKQLDQEEAAKSGSDKGQSTTSTPGLFAPSNNSDSQHGAAYWLFTVVAVVILAFVFIRQFMINKKSSSEEPFKPSLAKPKISNQAAIDKYNQSKPAPLKKPAKASTPIPTPKKINPISTQPTAKVKPVSLKSKSSAKTEDDNKGKNFEVRV